MGVVAGAGVGIWLILYTFLPVINAVVDWLSWAVTRWFVRKAARQGSLGWVFVEALADILAACFCLILLAALLPNVLALYDHYIAAEGAEAHWDRMAQTAVLDPFGAGLLVTGMLLTTLVPTAIHLWIGVRGLFLWPTGGHGDLAGKLRAWSGRKTFDDLDLEERVIRAVQTRRWRVAVAGVLAAVLVGLATLAVAFAIPRLGNFLFETAMCATWWQGHSCAPFLSSLGL